MDKRTLIAFILIGIIFFGSMYLMMPQRPQTQPQPVGDTTRTIPDTLAEVEQPMADTAEDIGYDDQLLEQDSLYAKFSQMTADTVRVETEKYIAKFYSRGGGLVSFKFKEYNYNNGDTLPIDMVPVWTDQALKFEFPDAEKRDFNLQNIVFTPNKTAIKISGQGATDKLVFHADLNEDEFIEVIYTFYAQAYDFDIKLDIEGDIAQRLGEHYIFGWQPGLESTEKDRKDDFNSFKANVMWDTGLEKYDKFEHGHLEQTITGAPQWVATRTKYFFVGIDPERDPSAALIEGDQVKVDEGKGELGRTRIGVQVRMPIHARKTLFDKYSVYIGPIDYDLLKSYNNGYHQAVDVGGILSPISLFILWLMKNLYSLLGNYGLVIIVFSILMKVVFYPLTSRSLKSMKKMQELQPKLKALQEKYKSEPQKLNAEVMKMWKENKVNPMGGCLLMLPQLPIFFALFTVFRNTILLRGAEFAFWMQDLSQPDQTLILPIIMGLTMFLQQKMTMQDPKQKMLVYILPIVFFFLFKGFSTGLVLYWTMFNVLSILETIIIRKPTQPKPEAAVETK
jgi:YidC/Oxa1 family membrane protein insertase